MLASALYQLLDGIFVGHVLGDTSFAALNLAFPFVIINFALADLIGVGSAVPISVNLGKKKEEEANNIFTCSALMIVVTGAATGAVMFACAPLFIRHDGRGRGVGGIGRALSSGLRSLFARNHHRLCDGQLPAHLRKDPFQHVSEYFYVRDECGLGGVVPFCFQNGYSGRGARHLSQHGRLRPCGGGAFRGETDAASFPQTSFSRRHASARSSPAAVPIFSTTSRAGSPPFS